MQTMAAAWMMVELTGSSFLAALVQTAVFLPMFLLSLPAGVLADITDRRRADPRGAVDRAGRSPAPAGRAVVRRLGRAGDAAVLHLRRRLLHRAAVAGLELDHRRVVPRDELPHAITAIGHRLQRRARRGPGARRRGVRAAGGAWNFVLCVVGTLVMLQTMRRWPPQAASAVAAAGRTPVGRHAQRAALRAPFADRAGAAGAHRGLQRCGLGAVGAAAGDRPAPADLGCGRRRPADGLHGRRRGGRRSGARQAACARWAWRGW